MGVSAVPPAVRIACIVTWVMSLLTAVLYLVIAVALLVDRHDFLRLVRENPALKNRSISDGELVAAVVAAAAVVVVWCLAACLLALLVWRRRRWAWILLLVSVGFAVVVEIVSLPYSLVHLAAAITALRLLLLAPTRAWLRGDDAAGSAGPRPPGPTDWAPPDPRWHQPSQEPTHESAPDSTSPSEEPSGKPPVW